MKCSDFRFSCPPVQSCFDGYLDMLEGLYLQKVYIWLQNLWLAASSLQALARRVKSRYIVLRVILLHSYLARGVLQMMMKPVVAATCCNPVSFSGGESRTDSGRFSTRVALLHISRSNHPLLGIVVSIMLPVPFSRGVACSDRGRARTDVIALRFGWSDCAVVGVAIVELPELLSRAVA